MANRPDPQAVGEFLLAARKDDTHHILRSGRQGEAQPKSFSELCDSIPWDLMPQLKSESLVDQTVKTYITELEVQAVAGVKSAARTLARLGYWHTCSKHGCDTPIPRDYLTCRDHLTMKWDASSPSLEEALVSSDEAV